MWYAPSRLLWKAIRFPSGLQAGRRFDALVFVSWRIGDAAAVAYVVRRATNAASQRTRKSRSGVTFTSALRRVARAQQRQGLPAQHQRKPTDEESPKQEGCLSGETLLRRGLRDERAGQEEVGQREVPGRPDQSQEPDQALHWSPPTLTWAGAGSLARPPLVAGRAGGVAAPPMVRYQPG